MTDYEIEYVENDIINNKAVYSGETAAEALTLFYFDHSTADVYKVTKL